MKLLTLFNHTGRRALFKTGFESWKKARRLTGDVKVIEDTASAREVPDVEYVTVQAGSSRMARYHALRHFFESDYTHAFFLDNDMIYAHHFDWLTYTLWLQYHNNHPICVASPHRPALAGHTALEADMGQYIWKKVTSDCALFMDRAAAAFCLEAINWPSSRMGWGWELAEKLNGCLIPHRSLVLNKGWDDGQNRLYGDDGYKFPGEDWASL